MDVESMHTALWAERKPLLPLTELVDVDLTGIDATLGATAEGDFDPRAAAVRRDNSDIDDGTGREEGEEE